MKYTLNMHGTLANDASHELHLSRPGGKTSLLADYNYTYKNESVVTHSYIYPVYDQSITYFKVPSAVVISLLVT